MKKFVIPTLAATAALGVAVPAIAVSGQQYLKVSVSPSKAGTAAKPKNVKLKVDTGVKPAPGAKGFATKKVVLSFDKNLVFGGSKFAECTQAIVQSNEASCPKGSKVGSGTAQGVALDLGESTRQDLLVTAYNGQKGKQLLLHVVSKDRTKVPNINSTIVATLGKASGKFGSKLTVPIPDNLQQPVPGALATLTQFVTKVGGTGKDKTPYVGLKGCPKGKLNVAGDFTYTDGTKQKAATTVKCSS